MAKGYDVKCWVLAGEFLADEPTINTPENRDALAQEIQTAIEDFIAERLANDAK